MKSILAILFCFMALKSFSQKEEAFVEEKSSSWIKVDNSEATRKSKTATVKKANSNPSGRQNSQQEFDKTNQEVNRFKKSKKN